MKSDGKWLGTVWKLVFPIGSCNRYLLWLVDLCDCDIREGLY